MKIKHWKIKIVPQIIIKKKPKKQIRDNKNQANKKIQSKKLTAT